MNKKPIFIILILALTVIITAATTYSLQMYRWHNDESFQENLLEEGAAATQRAINLIENSEFIMALETFFDSPDTQDRETTPNGDTAINTEEKSSDNPENQLPSEDLNYTISSEELLFNDYQLARPEREAEREVEENISEEEEQSKDIDEEKLEESLSEESMGVKAEPEFVERIREQVEKYPDHFFVRSFSETNKIALTFDDGPGPYTEQILDILAAYDIEATFFVVGYQVVNFPGAVTRIAQEGHLIGNHSYSHQDFSRLEMAEVEREIERTNQVIKNEIGYEPELIRPPYGRIINDQLETLINEGYRFINWSVDSLDWNEEFNEKNQMLTRIKQTIHPGGIVLLHDAGGDRTNTVELLPALIEELKDKGYEFVTVDELLF